MQTYMRSEEGEGCSANEGEQLLGTASAECLVYVLEFGGEEAGFKGGGVCSGTPGKVEEGEGCRCR